MKCFKTCQNCEIYEPVCICAVSCMNFEGETDEMTNEQACKNYEKKSPLPICGICDKEMIIHEISSIQFSNGKNKHFHDSCVKEIGDIQYSGWLRARRNHIQEIIDALKKLQEWFE